MFYSGFILIVLLAPNLKTSSKP